MTLKEFIKLYKLVSHNTRLSEKRHPLFERNRFMKIFTYLMVAFWAGYLIFFGVIFGQGFREESREGCDVLNMGFMIFLVIDFVTRFGMQETPAHEVMPYKLLPIPSKSIVDIFLIKRGWNIYNLFFLFFFVPFGIITIALVPYFGFTALVGYLIGVVLMFVANAYYYLWWRTLINHHMYNLIFPFAIYAAIGVLGLWVTDVLPDWSMRFMRGFIEWNPLCFISVIVVIIGLFFLNRWMQYRLIYTEIARVDKVVKVKSNEMSFLNRYGVIGEYLKLECKSIWRNPVVKKMFGSAFFLTLCFCCITAFTDAYDAGFMRVFICVYCFAVFGIMTLTNIMGVEGNYIDGLMSRKESVLALLKAKYYFNIGMLFMPLMFLIIPVCTGKFHIMEIIGCMSFTAGCIIPCLFILAAYNNTTLNLTQKLSQRTSNSKAQMIVSFATMFLPMGIMFALVTTIGNVMAGVVLAGLGAIGILFSPKWLKLIYKLFMNNRYENMSNFRTTRSA